MRILIIGGTRFMGPFVARRLLALGHSVTVFHRGQTPGDLPPEVQHLYCPDLDFGTRRELVNYLPALRELAPEVVLDMIPMTEAACASPRMPCAALPAAWWWSPAWTYTAPTGC